MLPFQLLIHVAGILNYVYSIHFQLNVVDIPDTLSKTRNLFGGPWKYLTFLNLWLQLLFHLIALANCVVGTSTLDRSGRQDVERHYFLYIPSHSH